ncbi:hypothetical protein GCM10010420_02580 [Streptomyces glaucosporus]|uniref:N-acetyltransferase domain-containing protein n=1 Tax=Streptomyces glaucosporus TaxID=284044 RepID=A0ABN3HNS7_9ACTN
MTVPGPAAPGSPGTPPEAAFRPAVPVTERLVPRPVERADVAARSRLWTDPEARRRLGGPVSGEVFRACERGCVGAVGLFAAALGADGPEVGSLPVEREPRRDGRTEVSYQPLPEHWGRGYGREALAAVPARALAEVTPERPEVIAVTQEADVRSRRLLEAVGMRRVDAFTEWGEPRRRRTPRPPAGRRGPDPGSGARRDLSVVPAMLPCMTSNSPAPWTLLDLDRALRDSWAADTCCPSDITRIEWTPENPAWGHCDITTLVVNDLFGGDLVVGEVFRDGRQEGYHWWNRLPSGVELDLTREQFRRGETVTGARTVERPPGPLPRRRDEYLLLRRRVAERLGPLPEPFGA